MASEIDHINLANKNHDTLAYLVQQADKHSEWVATVAFYKAVQVVEAVFASHLKTHSHGHDSRIADLKRPAYSELFKAYRPLYVASLIARYLEDSASAKLDGKKPNTKSYRCFADYLSSDEVIKRLLGKRLKTLEALSVEFLSKNGKKALKRVVHFLESEESTEPHEGG